MAEYTIKDSGERQEFSTGAVRDTQENKGRFDLLPMAALTALAIHYEKGCKKYGDRNWEKGIPVSRFLNSGMRHLTKAIVGMNDENHLIAAIWNLMCAYETVLRVQTGQLTYELNDTELSIPDPWDRAYNPKVKIEIPEDELPF